MQLVRHLNDYHYPACVLTIGNFDGVHLGHQALLCMVNDLATLNKLPSIVMSFSPSPKIFFGQKVAQINTFKQRFLLLQQQQITALLLLKFNQNLANLEADNFVIEILVNQLNIKHIVIGDDFVFGKNRTGNKTLLEKLGQQYSFEVHQINRIQNNQLRISSSAVRHALSVGDFNNVNDKLGYIFSMSGKVVHGDKKGRTIGFPTLNIPLKRDISPISGVFAIEATLNNQAYQGVANIGYRPTVNGTKNLLEVHVFNFDKQVYGQEVRITFYAKIRNEQAFKCLEDLKQQIHADVLWVKSYFQDNAKLGGK